MEVSKVWASIGIPADPTSFTKRLTLSLMYREHTINLCQIHLIDVAFAKKSGLNHYAALLVFLFLY